VNKVRYRASAIIIDAHFGMFDAQVPTRHPEANVVASIGCQFRKVPGVELT